MLEIYFNLYIKSCRIPAVTVCCQVTQRVSLVAVSPVQILMTGSRHHESTPGSDLITNVTLPSFRGHSGRQERFLVAVKLFKCDSTFPITKILNEILQEQNENPSGRYRNTFQQKLLKILTVCQQTSEPWVGQPDASHYSIS